MLKWPTMRRLALVHAVTILLPAAGARPTGAAETVIKDGPKAWALATSALLTYANGGRFDTLSPHARDAATIAEIRGVLERSWGIQTRSDLLGVLERLDYPGHRGEFQRMGQELAAMTEARYQASLFHERHSHELVVRMKLTREHYPKHRDNSLVAWDYGRYIMVCRWGHTIGFLTADEAWDRIMPAARKIQSGYHSWSEMAEDYLVGREFWSSEEMARTGKYYHEIEAWLKKDPKSPWRRMRWRMDLKRGL
jgi:hypothetical protein